MNDVGSADVHHSFALLADDLAGARVPERLEQAAVERQRPLEVGDDEVEVIHARVAHGEEANLDTLGEVSELA